MRTLSKTLFLNLPFKSFSSSFLKDASEDNLSKQTSKNPYVLGIVLISALTTLSGCTDTQRFSPSMTQNQSSQTLKSAHDSCVHRTNDGKTVSGIVDPDPSTIDSERCVSSAELRKRKR